MLKYFVLFVALSLCSVASGQDCSTRCRNAGAGGGTTIGTAPFCDGKCSEDCPAGNLCFPNQPANCWTGNKICCCDRKPSLNAVESAFPDSEEEPLAIHQFVTDYNVCILYLSSLLCVKKKTKTNLCFYLVS